MFTFEPPASRSPPTTAQPARTTGAGAAAAGDGALGRLLLRGHGQTVDNFFGTRQRGVAEWQAKSGSFGADGTDDAFLTEWSGRRDEAQRGESGQDWSVAVEGARRRGRPIRRGLLAGARQQTQLGLIGAVRKSVADWWQAESSVVAPERHDALCVEAESGRPST